MGIELALSALAGVLFALPFLFEASGRKGGRLVSGKDELVGATATVLAPETPGAAPVWVQVHGERWKVRADRALTPSALVRVEAVRGLELVVAPLAEDPAAEAPRGGYRPSRIWWAGGLVLWLLSITLAALGWGSIVMALLACPGAAALLLVGFGTLTEWG